MKDKKHYHYTALFCEENIWHLAKTLENEGFSMENMTVLLLSNPLQQIVVLNQSSCPEGEAVIWDYHVILQLEKNNQPWIYDFDSRLDFPISKKSYFCASFPKPDALHKPYQMFIRYIPANNYLQRFSSDRSHMKGIISADKFPSYPPILAKRIAERITLTEYFDISRCLSDGSWVERYLDN
ncbi:MAG: hypothetical protein GQ569_02795 [Methylococcaceae bacterium]|nr:hypothetical protein [Methylococcaceae bacterium]